MFSWIESVWQQLVARLDELPHALLVHGPRGIGKLELARRFGQLILCETPGAREPCGQCEGCRWFAAGQHPDYRQIEPEALAVPPVSLDGAAPGPKTAKPSTEIKIDQVRDLAQFVNIGSHRGRRRVALFHPAEEMNQNAANALLKSLEEPPSTACFILVSNRPQRLLPTIRSRCVNVSVPLPNRGMAEAWLEQTQIPLAGDWLAFAGGAPLLAKEYATSAYGERLTKLMKLLRHGDRDGLLSWPATQREDMEMLAEVLQKWAYDQVFLCFSGQSRFFRGLASAPGTVPTHGCLAWLRFAREAGRFRAQARHPLNPRLFAAQLISMLPHP